MGKDYLFGPAITQPGLEQLKKYKYQSGGYSYLDNLLNPWWTFCAELLPLWMAPNVVTLIGLVAYAISFFLVIYHSPNLYDDLPRWLYMFTFLSQFFYQTMDAIDGKHARKTGMSGPLGQLFDHGCDSVGVVFLTVPVACALKLGFSVYTQLALLCVQLPFFCAQWEEYHTHRIRTHIGGIGVTEGQFTCFAFLLLDFFFGTGIWTMTLSELVPPLSPLLSVIGLGAWPVNYSLSLLGAVHNLKIVYINITTVTSVYKGFDKIKALAELAPVTIMLSLGLVWRHSEGFQSNPLISTICIGVVFSHLTTQMIICSCTRMRYPLLQWTVVFFPLVVYASFVDLHSKLVIWGYLVLALLLLARYIATVIDQITSFLGITCFTVKKRD